MITGIVSSDKVTPQHPCPRCNEGFASNPEYKVYLQVDPLNPQIPATVYHPECAASSELDRILVELNNIDFTEAIAMREGSIYEIVRGYLCWKYETDTYVIDTVVRRYNELNPNI